MDVLNADVFYEDVFWKSTILRGLMTKTMQYLKVRPFFIRKFQTELRKTQKTDSNSNIKASGHWQLIIYRMGDEEEVPSCFEVS